MAILCIQVDSGLLGCMAGRNTPTKVRAALAIYFAAGAPPIPKKRYGAPVQTTIQVDDETWYKVKALGRGFGATSTVINAALWFAVNGGVQSNVSFD